MDFYAYLAGRMKTGTKVKISSLEGHLQGPYAAFSNDDQMVDIVAVARGILDRDFGVSL